MIGKGWWIGCAFILAMGCGRDTAKDGDGWTVGENAPFEERDPGSIPDDPPVMDDPIVDDPDPVVEPDALLAEELAGYWMQSQIGNCIDTQEWLGFGSSGDFERVFADRNACHEHSVTVELGAWEIVAPNVVRWAWTGRGVPEGREYTVAVVDRGQTLAVGALMRVGDEDGHFVARRVIESGVSPRSVEVDLRVKGLQTQDSESCLIDVAISVDYTYPESAREVSGREEFSFDCSIQHAPGSGITSIVADGFEDPASDPWMELFRNRGIWDRYDAPIADMMFSAFRPVLSNDWAHPDVMLSTAGIQSYWRAEGEPPRTLEELDNGN